MLWLQTGIGCEDAAARAEKGGLMVVMDAHQLDALFFAPNAT